MLRAGDFLIDQRVLTSPHRPAAPKVSVVLPTFRRCGNGSLERAVRSVLSQTCRSLELIVVDDGSTDGTHELVEQLRGDDPRIVNVRHEDNSGLPALRVNEGIEVARGRYLAFQFDDDVWLPRALDALVDLAERQAEPSVAVGRACFTGTTGQWLLPTVELDPVTLHRQNRLANNSVLVPRELLERFGLYDCHAGMRRLTDWDLWLRLIRHVPFVVLGEVVSEVFESNPGSIGRTVPWDIPLFRCLHDIPRNELLAFSGWRDYPVHSLNPGGVEVPRELKRRLYEEHVVPHLFGIRHLFPELEGFSATLPSSPRSVVYTKNSYDVSNDVTLNHYDPVATRRGTFKTTFRLLDEVGPGWSREADALLLVRTVEARGVEIARRQRVEGAPLGYYLDDDLLTFHEYGDEFAYLAPGTPYHDNLQEQVRAADAVWVTNAFIADSVRPLNPRVIPHNNAVPAEVLPERLPPRGPDRPLRIGYAGSGYRMEEFRHLWDALRTLSEELGDKVSFEFWGLDVTSLPALASPLRCRAFTFSYPMYLHRLKETGFDVFLAPLLDRPRPRLAKSLIKYYESAVAGALGVFSDVPPYASLPGGTTCLKAGNTVTGWLEALRLAARMPPDHFDRMRQKALDHVREEFTEVAQIHLHEAAWRATEFHARTRHARHEDGRPRVLYFLHSANLGGGEIQLLRRLRRARRYGIEPLVAVPAVLRETEAVTRLAAQLEGEELGLEFAEYTCFDEPRSPRDFRSELESAEIRRLLERTRPALVHSVTFIPTVGQVCRELRIPHVASLYAVGDGVAWPEGGPGFRHAEVVQSDSLRYARRWGGLLEAEAVCAREVAPTEVFDLGRERLSEPRAATTARRPVRVVVTGTLQERKGQLEAIRAVGRLRREGRNCQLDLYGYSHFFPDYVARCREAIRADQLEQSVRLRGFGDDVIKILSSTDIVLSCSTYESFPSAIKEAMAAAVLVVATPAGGIRELVVDGVSGIMCRDTTVDALTEGLRRAIELPPERREAIVRQARRVARSEFHPDRASSDMLAMYCRTLELAVPAGEREAPPPTPLQKSAQALEHVEAPVEAPGGHTLLRRKLRYSIATRHRGWHGLDVLLGTHGRFFAGRLRLRVLTRSGEVLRDVSADLSRARDNDWLTLRFPQIGGSRGAAFDLELSLFRIDPTSRLSVYEADPPVGRIRRVLRRLGLGPRRRLYHRLRYSR